MSLVKLCFKQNNYKHKLVTYTNATGRKKFLEANNVHPDSAFISQPEKKINQHSFNLMALSLKSVECQYYFYFFSAVKKLVD